MDSCVRSPEWFLYSWRFWEECQQFDEAVRPNGFVTWNRYPSRSQYGAHKTRQLFRCGWWGHFKANKTASSCVKSASQDVELDSCYGTYLIGDKKHKLTICGLKLIKWHLKIEFLRHRKHTNTLHFRYKYYGQCFRELIAVCYKKYSKYPVRQIAEHINVQRGGTYRDH